MAGLLATGAVTLSSCDEETLAAIVDAFTLNEEGGYYSGYNFDNENLDEIEDDINLASRYASSGVSGQLPSKVDLTNYLPPIGDQGQYGTCVAWATAYNCRTFLNAKTKGLSKSQLTSASNQFSPKDIFLSISNSDKGSNCGGTSFEAAFDKMVSRGVATLANQPYTGLGSCSQSASGSSDAGSHKIKSYREIKTDATTLKQYLAEGKLVVFGAELGDEFMRADGSSIIYKQTSFNLTGQHAYHAMVLSGYDDSMGTNGAFRVVNSWGNQWGDNGYVWVDQKFFCGGKFCYCAFVAYDQNEDNNKVDTNEENIVINQNEGYDLISTELDFYPTEYADGQQWYNCDYNVYNAGNKVIAPSNDWGICLLYYNAYNADDMGILLLDLYTDKMGSGYDWDWDANEAKNALGGIEAQGYSWNNFAVKGGQCVSDAVGSDGGFAWEFSLPKSLNGKYYLVLAADAFDDITESNEDNNYLYFTAAGNKPLDFVNGRPTNLAKNGHISKAGKTFRQNDPSPLQDVRTADNVNAYTTDEISMLLNYKRKNGTIRKMAEEWLADQPDMVRPKTVRK